MTAPAHRSVARQLWQLAAPIIGLNVLSVLTLAVDTAMCGRLHNSDVALEALGFSTQVVFLAMVAMMGLTVGTVAMVSRAYGARRSDRVNHVLAQSTLLTVLVGAGVAVLGNVFAAPLLRLLGASEPVVAEGLRYLRVVLGGAVFYYLTILFGGVLRGVGNTRLPFLVALLANAVNVVLDYGLIRGRLGLPGLGVQGAAIATIISYALNAGLLITLVRRDAVPGLFLPLTPRPLDRPLAAELFRVGAPAALDMLMINIAFLSIIGMLGRIDEVAVAAHGIGLRIQALAFVPGLSVSQATGAMVGQALGAHDVPRARKVTLASVAMCTLIMTTLGLAIIAAAYPIVHIFDVAPGSSLERLSIEWMRLLGYCMPVVGVHIAFVGLLQGAGSTRTSLAINFVGTVLFQVPLGAALGLWADLGAFGVWLSFPLSFVVKAGLSWLAFQRGRWAKTGVHV